MAAIGLPRIPDTGRRTQQGADHRTRFRGGGGSSAARSCFCRVETAPGARADSRVARGSREFAGRRRDRGARRTHDIAVEDFAVGVPRARPRGRHRRCIPTRSPPRPLMGVWHPRLDADVLAPAPCSGQPHLVQVQRRCRARYAEWGNRLAAAPRRPAAPSATHSPADAGLQTPEGKGSSAAARPLSRCGTPRCLVRRAGATLRPGRRVVSPVDRRGVRRSASP